MRMLSTKTFRKLFLYDTSTCSHKLFLHLITPLRNLSSLNLSFIVADRYLLGIYFAKAICNIHKNGHFGKCESDTQLFSGFVFMSNFTYVKVIWEKET